MEPLTALAVASSVVQFVDFAGKVFTQTIKIYRATPDGAIGEKNHLESITRDFKEHNEVLKSSLQPHQNSQPVNLSTADREIVRICCECEVITSKLLSALGNLRSSQVSLWNSFVDALKSVWSEAEIQNLRQTLDSYRQQISLYLLTSLRDQIRAFQESQSSSDDDLRTTVEQTRVMVERFFFKVAKQQHWQQEIIRAIHADYERNRRSNSARLSLPAIGMQQQLTSKEFERFSKDLLHWLRFTELDYRYEKIERAYGETFEWIFRPAPDDQWSGFVEWSQDDSEPLYWITGKPAAGKSTLMKFIYSDPRTKQLLHRWANDKKLIISAFYFWNSGTELQMSTEGMARTLLYETLRQDPTLWDIAFPQKMEEYFIFGDAWQQQITWDEIIRAFRNLVEEAGDKYKLFFFIDGLDEFDGKHDKLITMIQGFLSPNVKICVSSRPWVVFEDGFYQRPSLRLEDITYKDIKHYVSSRLGQNRGFVQLQILNPSYAAHLIDNVVKKASGVFLWVHLVTDSLREGLSEGERLEELQERLDRLPPDLEHLFWNILSRLGESHLKRASEFFQIFRLCRKKPLDLLSFSYADESDPDIASKVPFGPPPIMQANARADIMRRRLNTCCKGLLEAKSMTTVPLFSTEIAYLHRTVKDYIERPEIWAKFLALTDSDFNPYVRLCNERIIRLRISSAVFFKWRNSGKEFWSIVTDAIAYAVLAGPKCTQSLRAKLLNALDIAATYLANLTDGNNPSYTQAVADKIGVPSIHWTGSRQGCLLNASILHLAIQSCFFEYVYEVAASPSNSNPAELSHGLLAAILQQPLDIDFDTSLHHPSYHDVAKRRPADLAAFLLSHGADPNFSVKYEFQYEFGASGTSTPWKAFLRMLGPDRDLTLQPCTPLSGPMGSEDSLSDMDQGSPFLPVFDEPAETGYTNTSQFSVEDDPTLYETMLEFDPKEYLRSCKYDSVSLVAIAKSFLEHGADPSLVRKKHGDKIWVLANEKLSERSPRGVERVRGRSPREVKRLSERSPREVERLRERSPKRFKRLRAMFKKDEG